MTVSRSVVHDTARFPCVMLLVEPDPRARLVQSKLDRYGLSYRWLAGQIGNSNRAVGAWVQAKERPRDPAVYDRMLTAIDTFLQERDPTSTVLLAKAGVRMIPIYGDSAAQGSTWAGREIVTVEVKDWGNDLERWGRYAYDRSMGTDILPGDLVIFESRVIFEIGDVVDATDDEGKTLTRAIGHFPATNKRRPVVVPLNDHYEPTKVSVEGIRGIVVEIVRQIDANEVTRREFKFGMNVGPSFETVSRYMRRLAEGNLDDL